MILLSISVFAYMILLTTGFLELYYFPGILASKLKISADLWWACAVCMLLCTQIWAVRKKNHQVFHFLFGSSSITLWVLYLLTHINRQMIQASGNTEILFMNLHLHPEVLEKIYWIAKLAFVISLIPYLKNVCSFLLNVIIIQLALLIVICKKITLLTYTMIHLSWKLRKYFIKWSDILLIVSLFEVFLRQQKIFQYQPIPVGAVILMLLLWIVIQISSFRKVSHQTHSIVISLATSISMIQLSEHYKLSYLFILSLLLLSALFSTVIISFVTKPKS